MMTVVIDVDVDVGGVGCSVVVVQGGETVTEANDTGPKCLIVVVVVQGGK